MEVAAGGGGMLHGQSLSENLILIFITGHLAQATWTMRFRFYRDQGEVNFKA